MNEKQFKQLKICVYQLRIIILIVTENESNFDLKVRNNSDNKENNKCLNNIFNQHQDRITLKTLIISNISIIINTLMTQISLISYLALFILVSTLTNSLNLTRQKIETTFRVKHEIIFISYYVVTSKTFILLIIIAR